jgi:hypothetical protein
MDGDAEGVVAHLDKLAHVDTQSSPVVELESGVTLLGRCSTAADE